MTSQIFKWANFILPLEILLLRLHLYLKHILKNGIVWPFLLVPFKAYIMLFIVSECKIHSKVPVHAIHTLLYSPYVFYAALEK